jgi:acyl-CoA reductase-like NAD-dependent aldehyde dehydrogenase
MNAAIKVPVHAWIVPGSLAIAERPGGGGRSHRVARALQAGIVWVNCWMIRDLRTPFGGMKQSGVGREGGVEALRFFTEAKNICIKL